MPEVIRIHLPDDSSTTDSRRSLESVEVSSAVSSYGSNNETVNSETDSTAAESQPREETEQRSQRFGWFVEKLNTGLRDHYFTLKCVIFLMRFLAFALNNANDIIIRNTYLLLSIVATTVFRFIFFVRLRPCTITQFCSRRCRLVAETFAYMIVEILLTVQWLLGWNIWIPLSCISGLFFFVVSAVYFYNRTSSRWNLTGKVKKYLLVFCHNLILTCAVVIPVIVCTEKEAVAMSLIAFFYGGLIWVPFDFEYDHAHVD